MSDHPVRLTGRLVVGLIVITLGVLFTLDNLGIVDSSRVLEWWPAVLVAVGISRLTGWGTRRRYTSGSVLVALGAWMLLHNLGYLPYGVSDLWPVLFIVVGASIVTRALGRGPVPDAGGDPSSTIHAFAMWAGTQSNVRSTDFRGGDVTAIMGGHEIDLRSAKTGSTPAVLDVCVIWGGVELKVPEDWNVSSEAMVIMGGLESHTKPSTGDSRVNLILRGIVLMGGVEIKN